MIIKATTKHAPEILNISDSCLGKKYITEDQTNRHIKNNSAWVYIINSSVVGFLFTTTDSTNNLIIKTVAISEFFQNKGIGKELLEYACNILARPNFSVYYHAWKENLPSYFSKTLLHMGFIESATIAEYWKKDSINKGYECAKCGNPCLCTMVIFRLKI